VTLPISWTVRRHAVVRGKQAQLLDLSRSSVYCAPRPASERDLPLIRRLDELDLDAHTTESASSPGSRTGTDTSRSPARPHAHLAHGRWSSDIT